MFRNMKLGLRLGMGFGVIIMLIVIMALFSIVQVGKISEDVDIIVNDRFPKTVIANTIINEINIVARVLRDMVIIENVADVEKENRRLDEAREKVNNALKEMESSIKSEEGKRLLSNISTSRSAYAPFQQKVVQLALENKDVEAATVMLGEFRNLQDKYMEAVVNLVDFQTKMTNEDGKSAINIANTIETTLIILSLIILLIGVFAAIVITRSIVSPLTKCIDIAEKVSMGQTDVEITVDSKDETGLLLSTMEKMVKSIRALIADTGLLSRAAVEGKLATRADVTKHSGDFRKVVEEVNQTLDSVVTPINEAAAVLEKVAARDLRARMEGDYKGDFTKIKNALNSAAENLDTALQQVTDATEQVSSASQQISAGSQSLAQGANQQASSLEEISSSLEEMSSMTKQNSDNAIQAKSLAGESDGNAKIGSEAMVRMSGAINRIKESSDQTAKIVKTIDEIAMQTNLLALNAAVEAARAGEAGRGFAVVAEEVRNLAQRSAQAAKNTADMISESVKNADDGVKIATEVAQSFDLIAASAKNVNDLIAEIASASQEQTQGIDQINSAVAQMDKVTQQNAANSEESASAAEELSSQAEELQSMVTQFNLSQDGNRARTVSHGNNLSHQIPVRKVSGVDSSKNFNKKNARKKDVSHAEEFAQLDDEVLKEF